METKAMSSQNNTQEHSQHAESIDSHRGLPPAVDIFENKGEILLLVDMPGVSHEDITIRLEKNELLIAGKRGPAPQGNALALEARPHDFLRTFVVPQGIVADGISAKTANGVLEIRLPKPTAQKPRQIAVAAS